MEQKTEWKAGHDMMKKTNIKPLESMKEPTLEELEAKGQMRLFVGEERKGKFKCLRRSACIQGSLSVWWKMSLS